MKNPIKKNFSANDLLSMVGHKKYREFSKNDYLFKENEAVGGVFFLLSGEVEITKKNTAGTETRLYVTRAPDIICMHSILEEELHSNSALASEKCRVCIVPKLALKKLIKDNSIAAFNIMRMFCLKINKIENQLSRAY
jgi:CRP/FNR family transcriptional regulator